MSPQQAESIVNSYGAALARGTNDGIARKLSWLPYSVCKIRLAFYVYLDELITRRALTQTLGEQLKNTYQGLNHFIADDDADVINDLHRQLGSGGSRALSESQQELYQQFLQRISRMDEMLEINSYINECFGQRDNQDFILWRR
jgi:hypothetical protein